MSRFHVPRSLGSVGTYVKHVPTEEVPTRDGGYSGKAMFLNSSGAALESGAPICISESSNRSPRDSFATISDEVYDHCRSFEDKTESMQKYSAKLSLPYVQLLPVEREHIEYCLEEYLSFAKCERLFNLMNSRMSDW